MYTEELTRNRESIHLEQREGRRAAHHLWLTLLAWFGVIAGIGALAAGAVFAFPFLEHNPLLSREEQAFVPLVAVRTYNQAWAQALETQNPSQVAQYVLPGSHEAQDLRLRIAQLRNRGLIERSQLDSLLITGYTRVDATHVQVRTHEVWRYVDIPIQGTPNTASPVYNDTEDEIYTFVYHNGHWLLESVTYLSNPSFTLTGNGP